ncbi:hypothetical protein FOA52_013760 [Chlamydomonas sp. UWO 241]|nr:hypothetical protein FOA52_013760 [Chlamydomonas sp. UWO 241]
MILPADFDADLPTFALTGGEVKTVSAFKYLGSWITQSGGVEKEIGVRVGRALGVFASYTNALSLGVNSDDVATRERELRKEVKALASVAIDLSSARAALAALGRRADEASGMLLGAAERAACALPPNSGGGGPARATGDGASGAAAARRARLAAVARALSSPPPDAYGVNADFSATTASAATSLPSLSALSPWAFVGAPLIDELHALLAPLSCPDPGLVPALDALIMGAPTPARADPVAAAGLARGPGAPPLPPAAAAMAALALESPPDWPPAAQLAEAVKSDARARMRASSASASAATLGDSGRVAGDALARARVVLRQVAACPALEEVPPGSASSAQAPVDADDGGADCAGGVGHPVVVVVEAVASTACRLASVLCAAASLASSTASMGRRARLLAASVSLEEGDAGELARLGPRLCRMLADAMGRYPRHAQSFAAAAGDFAKQRVVDPHRFPEDFANMLPQVFKKWDADKDGFMAHADVAAMVSHMLPRDTAPEAVGAEMEALWSAMVEAEVGVATLVPSSVSASCTDTPPGSRPQSSLMQRISDLQLSTSPTPGALPPLPNNNVTTTLVGFRAFLEAAPSCELLCAYVRLLVGSKLYTDSGLVPALLRLLDAQGSGSGGRPSTSTPSKEATAPPGGHARQGSGPRTSSSRPSSAMAASAQAQPESRQERAAGPGGRPGRAQLSAQVAAAGALLAVAEMFPRVYDDLASDKAACASLLALSRDHTIEWTSRLAAIAVLSQLVCKGGATAAKRAAKAGAFTALLEVLVVETFPYYKQDPRGAKAAAADALVVIALDHSLRDAVAKHSGLETGWEVTAGVVRALWHVAQQAGAPSRGAGGGAGIDPARHTAQGTERGGGGGGGMPPLVATARAAAVGLIELVDAEQDVKLVLKSAGAMSKMSNPAFMQCVKDPELSMLLQGLHFTLTGERSSGASHGGGGRAERPRGALSTVPSERHMEWSAGSQGSEASMASLGADGDGGAGDGGANGGGASSGSFGADGGDGGASGDSGGSDAGGSKRARPSMGAPSSEQRSAPQAAAPVASDAFAVSAASAASSNEWSEDGSAHPDATPESAAGGGGARSIGGGSGLGGARSAAPSASARSSASGQQQQQPHRSPAQVAAGGSDSGAPGRTRASSAAGGAASKAARESDSGSVLSASGLSASGLSSRVPAAAAKAAAPAALRQPQPSESGSILSGSISGDLPSRDAKPVEHSAAPAVQRRPEPSESGSMLSGSISGDLSASMNGRGAKPAAPAQRRPPSESGSMLLGRGAKPAHKAAAPSESGSMLSGSISGGLSASMTGRDAKPAAKVPAPVQQRAPSESGSMLSGSISGDLSASMNGRGAKPAAPAQRRPPSESGSMLLGRGAKPAHKAAAPSESGSMLSGSISGGPSASMTSRGANYAAKAAAPAQQRPPSESGSMLSGSISGRGTDYAAKASAPAHRLPQPSESGSLSGDLSMSMSAIAKPAQRRPPSDSGSLSMSETASKAGNLAAKPTSPSASRRPPSASGSVSMISSGELSISASMSGRGAKPAATTPAARRPLSDSGSLSIMSGDLSASMTSRAPAAGKPAPPAACMSAAGNSDSLSLVASIEMS